MLSRPNLLMFCFGVALVGTLYSLIASGVWFGANQIDFINAVSGMGAVKDQTLGSYANVASPFAWLSAIVKMVSWNYPYLDSAWGLIIKMLIFYPVTIGIVVAVWEVGIQIIGTLVGMIRSVF